MSIIPDRLKSRSSTYASVKWLLIRQNKKAFVQVFQIFNLALILAPLLILITITGCNATSTSHVEESKNKDNQTLNVLVLVDLSDRIIVQEGQRLRDKEILKHISSEMVNIIRKNGVDKSNDVLKITIAEQNNIPYSTLSFQDSLYFKMTKGFRGGMPNIKKIFEGRFPRNIDRLYEIANYSSDGNDYSGANISRYFIKDLNHDIKRDSSTSNLLIILTDGYVVVGNKANVMLDIHQRYPELKVLVLEIAPRKKAYESEKIIKSWDSWFEHIGIEGYALRNIGPTEAMKDEVTKFLNGNLELTVPGKLKKTSD